MSAAFEAGDYPLLRPRWLRPVAGGAPLLVHLAAFGVLALTAAEPPSATSDSFEVAYVQDGEAARQASADTAPDELSHADDSTVAQDAAEAQTAEAPKTPAPDAPTPLALAEAKIQAPDALALPLAKPRDDEPKPTLDQRPDREKASEQTPLEPTAAEGKVQRQATAAAEASEASSSSADQIGATDGRKTQSGATRARYGAKVLAEIHKHMFYPPQARRGGAKGDAIVVFTVGSDGHMVERKIAKSAGDDALDRAALAMVDATIAPPPPAGRFYGRTTIKFDIRH
ncbi:MAG TPA: TonB family protein [Methylosinus sp.]|jgi:protein TonB|uniref:TonB family protein n=1 Tax=Hyphomicrobiales TaxID=356 RepID=UPI002F92420A